MRRGSSNEPQLVAAHQGQWRHSRALAFTAQGYGGDAGGRQLEATARLVSRKAHQHQAIARWVEHIGRIGELGCPVTVRIADRQLCSDATERGELALALPQLARTEISA